MKALNYEVELAGNWILIPEFVYELKGGHTGAFSIDLEQGSAFERKNDWLQSMSIRFGMTKHGDKVRLLR